MMGTVARMLIVNEIFCCPQTIYNSNFIDSKKTQVQIASNVKGRFSKRDIFWAKRDIFGTKNPTKKDTKNPQKFCILSDFRQYISATFCVLNFCRGSYIYIFI